MQCFVFDLRPSHVLVVLATFVDVVVVSLIFEKTTSMQRHCISSCSNLGDAPSGGKSSCYSMLGCGQQVDVQARTLFKAIDGGAVQK